MPRKAQQKAIKLKLLQRHYYTVGVIFTLPSVGLLELHRTFIQLN